MSLSKREAALLGLLLVLGCVYLINNYIFNPLLTHKQQLMSENSNLTVELKELQNRIGKYRTMEEQRSLLEDNYYKMLESVPESPMIPSIIDYLGVKAQDTNVKLISIHYKKNTAADISPHSVRSELQFDQVSPISFQIVAKGSHFDLLSFVLEIENAPRIYIINRGKISLGKTDQSTSMIAMPVNNAAMAVNGQVMDKTVPESITYDQSKSVLELDFTAYYQSSALNGDA